MVVGQRVGFAEGWPKQGQTSESLENGQGFIEGVAQL